jgi:uncharacterized protein YprB with RNaseH-like and TPR domain
MITRHFSIEQTPNYALEQDFPLDKIVFFDIETTGLGADTSYLYLIGCVYCQKDQFYLIQWFSENLQEEEHLITSFFEFISNKSVLIHYNGTGFDIPYIKKKCSLLDLPYSFDHIESFDLYKKIAPYKKLFKLNNYKQKSLETFLNIVREDTFDGGELIQVYQSYLGKKHYEKLRKMREPEAFDCTTIESDQLLHQLILHNEDDLKGLLSLCPLFHYFNIFEKPIRIIQTFVDNGILSIQFEISASIPIPIHHQQDLVRLDVQDKEAVLSIRIYEGELKHFYENHKDYYYLPAEDQAIHKSLAGFVEKDYRVKAKPSNCYVKREGLFTPQMEPVITPYFKMKHTDKLSFLEIHTDFLLQEEHLETYVKHLLTYIITS